MSKQIFGPVPSRRLGLSLGIDLVPHKTCTFDCIYCECGKTTNLVVERKSWFNPDEILNDLSEVIRRNIQIDYITFSGSGEPTLSKDIGYLINKIKSTYSIPVCVLTNGTLLYLEEVRNDLKNADVVMPSLDAVDEEMFRQINRPAKSLELTKVVHGLIKFRKIFKGKLILEILFVRGINDSLENIKKISSSVDKIKPDKIQLNTCVRPGTEKNLDSLTHEELKEIAEYFNYPVEIISSFNRNADIRFESNDIIKLLKRRPCTIKDLSSMSSMPEIQIIKILDYLTNQGHNVIRENINEENYYSIEIN